jgi:hypothetical protein
MLSQFVDETAAIASTNLLSISKRGDHLYRNERLAKILSDRHIYQNFQTTTESTTETSPTPNKLHIESNTFISPSASPFQDNSSPNVFIRSQVDVQPRKKIVWTQEYLQAMQAQKDLHRV